MIERLLDNWLSRANERSFQIPFCHSLAYSGHTVVHLSRHCAMEMGKDILSIGPDGVPCAFQLKGVEGGGKLSLAAWRSDLEKQLIPLVTGRIVHPSIPDGTPHRAYIVVNGELEEEVCRAIDDFNRGPLVSAVNRKLEVIVRGELFQRFRDLQSDFWATNLSELKTFLEMYLEDGRGQLPKEKIASLFEKALPFERVGQKDPSRAELTKAVAGCAIICASSISAFTNVQNHLAEFEAWTMFWAYVLALAERWAVPMDQFRFATDVAQEAMYSALGRLCDELMERDNLGEGSILTDKVVYEVRITQLLGLVGLYGLWHANRLRAGVEGDDTGRQHFLRNFCLAKRKSLYVWGEYAIPQILAYNFFRRTFDATKDTDYLYYGLMNAIVNANGEGDGALANPYYDAETILPYPLGLEREPLNDSFHRSSYYLEGLMHLFARANAKQHMRWIYPSIAKFSLRRYMPAFAWKYYFWRDRSGKSHSDVLQPPHSWAALRALAAEDRGDELPSLIKADPLAYLCFLLVYPHRVNASGLRWLSSGLVRDSSSTSR
jgi:hypothetical protein